MQPLTVLLAGSGTNLTANPVFSVSSAAAGESGTGYADGHEFEFNIPLPDALSGDSRTVAYTATSSDRDKVSVAGGTITFRSGLTSVTETVALSGPGVDPADDVTITVALVDGSDYGISNSNSEITVDVKNAPEVSISLEKDFVAPDATDKSFNVSVHSADATTTTVTVRRQLISDNGNTVETTTNTYQLTAKCFLPARRKGRWQNRDSQPAPQCRRISVVAGTRHFRIDSAH